MFGEKGVSKSDEAAVTIHQTFMRAEQAGLRLAIIGRTVALILIGCWFLFSRSGNSDLTMKFGLALFVFIALGAIHYSLIGRRFDSKILKYVFITIDFGIISALVATQPLYASADLPTVMLYRTSIFPIYFVVLGVAAFSFSPGMLLWSGFAGAVGWVCAFFWKTKDMTDLLGWPDVPANPTAEQVIEVVLNPMFGGFGGRLQEALFLVVVALLIAIVMRRARGTLQRQLEAEKNSADIKGMFGRFVPKSVVDAMITDSGTLKPVEREATVLFADIVGFTKMTEAVGPVSTVEVLNAYFDEMTQIIGAKGGVITQFQGDAILATFNVPIVDENHAKCAFLAAKEMLLATKSHEFSGENLSIRIGINTGRLVAGNVGGGGRQSYTVHGDAVNIAARLEAMNKTEGTSLLVSAATAAALSIEEIRPIGEITVRGISDQVKVYTAKDIEN